MIDYSNRPVGELVLSDVLFTKATILQERYDDLLNGMLNQTIDYVNPMYTPEVWIDFLAYFCNIVISEDVTI